MCRNWSQSYTTTARPIHLRMFARALCCYWQRHSHSPPMWHYSGRLHRSTPDFPLTIARLSPRMQSHLPMRTMASASVPIEMPMLLGVRFQTRLSLGPCSPLNCSLHRMYTSLGTSVDTSAPAAIPTVHPNTISIDIHIYF